MFTLGCLLIYNNCTRHWTSPGSDIECTEASLSFWHFISLCSPSFMHILLMCPALLRYSKNPTKQETKPFSDDKKWGWLWAFLEIVPLRYWRRDNCITQHYQILWENLEAWKWRFAPHLWNGSSIRHLHIIIMDYYLCYKKCALRANLRLS